MAARLLGLGALVVVAAGTALDAEAAAVAYGLAVMVLLWVEAWWLARAPAPDPAEDGPPAGEARPGDGAPER